MHQPLSVSEVTSYLGELLEANPVLSELWVEGELSEFKRHSSGHCYFNLKDERALLKGVMWRSAAERLGALPRSGDLVLAHGRLAFYAPRGDLQIYVDRFVPAGLGLLQARFEELKARLEREGLFALERKRPLPPLPRRIGIVTALGGAALQDMLKVLERRYPLVEVRLSPCLVQGERAPDSIVEALYLVYAAEVDLVILARGGGSLEDLWAFNDEAVARAIFASPVPVISGIGHETDTTIADFVADLRAPTPSVAAELAAPSCEALAEQLLYLRAHLDALAAAALATRRDDLIQAERQISRFAPQRRLARDRQQVDELARRMERVVTSVIELRHANLVGLHGRLATLSPQATLARGYALVRRLADGQVVTSPAQTPPATALTLTLRDGEVLATVPSASEQMD
ncbi:MAG: exodeoxyribonuclease VII large subunit [Oscillochloridaceae bacterium umkhey_bin13]